MRTLLLIALAAATPLSAGAVDRATKDYDRNANGRLDAGIEATVYGLHKSNPMLAKYDDDFDGKLGPAELERIGRDLGQWPAEASAVVGRYQDEARQQGGIPLAQLDEKQPAKPQPCPGSRAWYVRRDPMDVSAYTGEATQKQAKGASLALTNEEVSGIESLEAHGVVTYAVASSCLPRPAGESGGYLASKTGAIWLQADGVRTGDAPDKDKSALKLGVLAQYGWFGGRFAQAQYVSFAPYWQTDFRGDARAYGVAASWEPYNLNNHLNGYYGVPAKTFDYYWQLRGEVDWLKVDDPGRTGLKADTDYAWFGGGLGLTVLPAPEALSQRLRLYGLWKYHHDVNNDIDARHYMLGSSLNLTEDGSVAISFERIWGLEREKLQEVEKTLFSLNFKR